MVVATVQNFMYGGDMNGKMGIKLKDIIDATTGDYLLETAYVQINNEIRQMELEQYDNSTPEISLEKVKTKSL